MSTFNPHNTESAPDGSRPILEGAQKSLGFVPNLYGVLAESPAALKAYTGLSAAYGGSSLDATEQQVVLITAAALNGCEYCVAAHSTIAGMQKLDGDVIGAVRDDRPIGDAKLEALRQFTQAVVRERGWVPADQVETFVAAGYTKAQLLEVIVGVGLKTISNYVNHIVDTPVDEQFAANAWKRPA